MAAAIERRSRYLRDFAHAVSHEFKTPLAGIRGAVELLQDHPDMAAEDQRRFLANADADARRLALLVTRLLHLARADMGEPGEEKTNAARVIARVADASRTADFSFEIKCLVAIPDVLLPATTLEAVLVTLLENSRRAGAKSVTIQLSTTDTQLEVRVNDDGPGVPCADQRWLFEPFFTTKRDTGGTGLGLAISRSLIRVQKGSLNVLDGELTTFVIRMPSEH
jgi:signal transduction histidine kinase